MTTVFSDLALKALLYEVSVSPKPGLVDRFNSGAHQDMDFFTFIDSSVALKQYFSALEQKTITLFEQGIVEGPSVFKEIQPLGVTAQEHMYLSTKGINTHKGAIYALGLNLVAVCEVQQQYGEEPLHKKELRIRKRISEYVSPAVTHQMSTFIDAPHMTYGQIQYLKYGLLGARGEALNGYPTVFEIGLPTLKDALNDGLSLNDAAIEVLIKIMTVLDDSNVIGRRGLEILRESQQYAREVLNLGAMRTPEGRTHLHAFDEWCIKENVSHGGAADLMAVVLFHHFVHQKTDNY